MPHVFIIECSDGVQLEVKARCHVEGDEDHTQVGEVSASDAKAIAAAIKKVYPSKSKSKDDED